MPTVNYIPREVDERFLFICRKASTPWLLRRLWQDASSHLTNGDDGLPANIRLESVRHTRAVIFELANRLDVDITEYVDGR